MAASVFHCDSWNLTDIMWVMISQLSRNKDMEYEDNKETSSHWHRTPIQLMRALWWKVTDWPDNSREVPASHNTINMNSPRPEQGSQSSNQLEFTQGRVGATSG